MAKPVFRQYRQHETMVLPPGPDDFIDENHPCRIVSNTYLYGKSCGQDNFKIIILGDVQVQVGREVELNCLAKNCLLFDENEKRIYAREEDIPTNL